MLGWLREARWLTAGRAAALGALLGIVPALYVAAAVLRVVAPPGPPGPTDFLSFHAASALALAGQPEAAWDPARHAAAQAAVVQAGYFAFFYPPIFLLICLPLALLSYPAAYLGWLAATGAACAAVLARYRAAPWPAVAALCVLAPAAVQNIANGQNAFLTTALLGAAGLALDRRPALAGACLATLAFKPQLGLLVLPALLAARRWRTLAWGVLAGLAWVAASGIVLGWESWRGFLASLPMAMTALEREDIGPAVLQSVFVSLRTLGVPMHAARMAQAAAAAAVILAVALAAARQPGGRAEVAAMAAGAPLATPFVLTYDMTLLLLPAIWLTAEGRRTGFLPWEKLGIAAVLLAPVATILAWQGLGVSAGPLAPGLTLLLVLRRAGAGGGCRTARGGAISAPPDTPSDR